MYKLNKIDLNNFLNSLQGKVYAPIKLIDGTVSYGLLTDGILTLENVLPIIGPKSVLFPPTEKLVYFESNNPEKVQTRNDTLYLFGVRSCDVAAIEYTDEFFCESSDFCDDVYSERRDKIIIIALGTEKATKGTFQTPSHTSSISKSGYDLNFIDHNDLYFVEIGSNKGKTVIENHKKFFKSCDKEDTDILVLIKHNAKTSMPENRTLNTALSRLNSDESLDKFWEEVADMCIECGGCSYVCPGCTCFNVYDLVNSDKPLSGYRERNWDSCMFKGFTKEASGHNHRKEQKDRIKRRYTHKLTSDNKVTCFGCGRCDLTCPVNLGMQNIIKILTTEETTAS